MAQFKSYVEGITVIAYTISTFVNSMGRNKESRLNILKKYDILELDNNQWYPIESFLAAVKEIHETIGDMNLYLMGLKAVKNSVNMPNNTLHYVLNALNPAVHMQHRLNGVPMFNPETGKMLSGLGEFALKEFDAENHHAIVVSSTPYASKTEEGALMGMLQVYEPHSKNYEVKEDINKPRKSQGGDSTTFILRW